MISGVDNGNLEATVGLLVRGPGGQEQAIEAVIDTGFKGFLTLSPCIFKG
jgi:predicted aspartyl protease